MRPVLFKEQNLTKIYLSISITRREYEYSYFSLVGHTYYIINSQLLHDENYIETKIKMKFKLFIPDPLTVPVLQNFIVYLAKVMMKIVR